MSSAVLQIKDHTGNFLCLTSPPQRIVSLVPSQTELLHSLGLNEQVVGITKFCIHPDEWCRSKVRIGGTKNIDIERVRSLMPDLIIANKEENVKEQVEILKKDYPVFTTDVKNLTDALAMIGDIGTITFRSEESNEICSQITNAFSTIPYHLSKKRVLYLIWKKPYMAAGGDTFISDMLKKAGFINVLLDQNRYPSITSDQIRELNPEIMLLSSEPYPFTHKHMNELKSEFPFSEIILADGTFFSWYGSRLQFAPAYFSILLSQIHQHEKIDP